MSTHPAQFPRYMVPVLVKALVPYVGHDDVILDPFAGLGYRLAQVAEILGAVPQGIEIEPGFVVDAHACVRFGDATDPRSYPRKRVKAIVTSPTYPNGMNDYFRSSIDDLSERNTYIHKLRRRHGFSYEMHPNNSGRYNARRGKKALARYFDINRQAIELWPDALLSDGVVVINTKDVVRADGTVVVEVTQWFIDTMRSAGFRKIAQRKIEASGLRQGSNHEVRADYEMITTFRHTGKR